MLFLWFVGECCFCKFWAKFRLRFACQFRGWYSCTTVIILQKYNGNRIFLWWNAYVFTNWSMCKHDAAHLVLYFWAKNDWKLENPARGPWYVKTYLIWASSEYIISSTKMTKNVLSANDTFYSSQALLDVFKMLARQCSTTTVFFNKTTLLQYSEKILREKAAYHFCPYPKFDDVSDFGGIWYSWCHEPFAARLGILLPPKNTFFYRPAILSSWPRFWCRWVFAELTVLFLKIGNGEIDFFLNRHFGDFPLPGCFALAIIIIFFKIQGQWYATLLPFNYLTMG